MTFTNDIREIPLTRGLVTLVDAADYEALAEFKWFALICGRGDFFYAARRMRMGEIGWVSKRPKLVLMHRQILRPGINVLVDHVDHNGINNRRGNLREATASQNGANGSAARGHTSAFFGVTWSGACAKWRARICVGRRSIYLGVFASEVEAALARDAAARRYFGDFASLNFPH